jgi:WD40 repeat protein
VAFSPNLEILAVGFENGTVELTSTRSGLQLKPLAGHSASILSIAFSPDGERLATGSADKTVRLWSIRARTENVTLQGHEMPVQCLAFSYDGRRLATGSWDGTVKLWDAKIRNNVDLWKRLKRQELATLRHHTTAVLSLAFTHDGFTLASADADNTVYLWKTTHQHN